MCARANGHRLDSSVALLYSRWCRARADHWLQAWFAFGAGARLKQRLFFGALRLEPDSITTSRRRTIAGGA